MKYDKLVRDKLPDIMREENWEFSMHVADDTEYERRLLDKLREEVDEFIQDKNAEELADVLEVLDALIDYYHFDQSEIAPGEAIEGG